VERFAKFLTFHTLADPETEDRIKPGHHAQFEALLSFLEEQFPDVYNHPDISVDRVGLGHWTSLFTWRGSDSGLEPALFISHYDVVPVTAGTEGDWTHGPFAGRVADGYVWGRGALDVKFSVTALLEAVAGLVRAGFTPARTLMFSFGHDEEVGGTGGAAKVAELLRSRGVKLDIVVDEGGLIIAEGMKGLTTHPVALIGCAEKVYTSVSVALRSPGGHSSMPPIDGSDIGAQVARLLGHIAAHPFPATLQSPITEFLEALAPYAHPAAGALLRNVRAWPLSALAAAGLARASRETAALVRTTVAATRISVGVADNVLPGAGQIVFNMRAHPLTPRDELLAYLRRAGEAARVTFTLTLTNASFTGPQGVVTPPNGRHYTLLKQAIQEYWRQDGKAVAVAPYMLTGGTDSKWFAPLSRHGVLRFVPYALNKSAGDLGRIHSTDERVAVADYGRAICTYERLLALLAEAPAPAQA